MKVEDSLFQTSTSIIISGKFQQVFHAYNVEEPIVKCKGGFLIQKLCTNKKCQNPAFHCSNKECKECFASHEYCYSAWFQGFTSLLKKRQTYQKDFFEKIYEIDNELIDKIKTSNEQIAKMISFGSFDKKYMDQLEALYVKKDSSAFKGKQADELYNKLSEKIEINKESQQKLQQLYNKRSNQLIQEDIRFKKQVYNCFLNSSTTKFPEVQRPFIDSPLIRMCLATMYANTPQCYKNKLKFDYCYLQSADKERYAFDMDKIKYLQQELYNPKSSVLLYRASENNYSAAEFHTKCNDKDHTLTIIRTEFGKTIFAYAVQKWNSSNTHINDPTGKSCIILLDQKKKCPVTVPANSIYCNPNYGPTFGAHDIYISNQCHKNNSFCNFPTSYNNGLTLNQISYTTICGAPSGYSFKVADYEVYQLKFE